MNVTQASGWEPFFVSLCSMMGTLTDNIRDFLPCHPSKR